MERQSREKDFKSADDVKIKNISLDQRPRERLVCNSVNSLSDAELLAVIFSMAKKQCG